MSVYTVTYRTVLFDQEIDAMTNYADDSVLRVIDAHLARLTEALDDEPHTQHHFQIRDGHGSVTNVHVVIDRYRSGNVRHAHISMSQ